MLVELDTFRPLWFQNLSFEGLNQIIDSVNTNDFPMTGLSTRPLYERAQPLLVSGYYISDGKTPPSKMIPKGIEIRTPVYPTIGQSVEAMRILHERLQSSLSASGYCAISLSHHPVETFFAEPNGHVRSDHWLWHSTAMSTYGPDINIGIPADLAAQIDLHDLSGKANFYLAAMTALTLGSPIANGGLWKIRGGVGKSLRTYRLSTVAPPYLIHNNSRFELKCLEMPHCLADFYGYFLIWLALLLDDELKGRAAEQSRIYDMGHVARLGLAETFDRERAIEILEASERMCDRFGFDDTSLHVFWDRVMKGRLPADEIIELYQWEQSLPETLRRLSSWRASLSRAA